MKKVLFVFCVSFLLFLSLGTGIFAEDNEFDVLYENAPEEFSFLFKNADGGNFSSLLSEILESGFGFALRVSGVLIGYTVIASVFTGQLAAEEKPNVMNVVSTTVCCLLLLPTITELIALTETYARQLIKFMTAFSAFSCASYLSCGYVTTAASGTLWLGILTTVTEAITEKALLPLLKVLTASTIADSTVSFGRLRGINSFMKSTYLQISIVFSTVIGAVLTVQTSLCRAQDGLSVRSIRFAATQAIPIVGPLVSDSLRTLLGAADGARKAGLGLSVGILLSITLPPLIAVIGTKIGIAVAGFTSDLLGGNALSDLYQNVKRLLDFMMISIGVSSAGFAICAAIFLSGSCQ